MEERMILILAVILCVVASTGAVYFGVRFCLMKKSVRSAASDLTEITGQLEENRVLKLEAADRDLEYLLCEMNRTLAAVRKEKTEFERREQELKRQIENISHDLRTPLTSILGYLRITDMEELPDETRENLEIVERKAEALSRLVEQFYEYSRISAEEYVPEIHQIDLGRILRETVLDSWKDIEQSGLELKFAAPESPVLIIGNENAAERIIRNLIQNACRYADSFLDIRLSSEEKGADLIFENDAEGLKEEDVEKIFGRFYVGESSRNGHGTGLGLTVAKTLAEKTGGSMKAEKIGDDRLQITVQWKK